MRDAAKSASLKSAGVEPVAFDDAASALQGATHIIQSIPPGNSGDPVLARYAAEIRAAKNLRWIGYLSTVGVYGDHGGAWVDEDTPPNPRSRARARASRRRTRGRNSRKPLAIFRIAGIYGPGRNALANLADGSARRIVKPGQIFNRIHVADIAASVAAAATQEATGVFNLADDEPAPPQDVIAFAANLMGVRAASRRSTSPPPISHRWRAVSTARAAASQTASCTALIGGSLRFPTYREGLTALWLEGTWRD